MEHTNSPARLKSIHKFSKLDNFSFNFFTFQYFVIIFFHFYYKIIYAAWGSILVFCLFIIIAFTKKQSFYHKTIAVVSGLMIFYTITYLLYGKSCEFLILPYLTIIISLIMIRYDWLMTTISILIITLIAIINYYDFWGYDYGNKKYYQEDISQIWFYFVITMTAIYSIVFLKIRTSLVNDIINDLKTKNLELEESKVELRKLQTNKESFFAIMSHEIRTPLNAIKGISDILKTKIEPEEHQNLLAIMDSSSNHLLALVNNILDFTKLNDGVFSLQYSEFNISNVLTSVFKMNERLAIEKGLEFQFQISNTLPEIVYGDKNRINQIVLNLINNAIEYTNAGTVKMLINGNYNANNENEFQLKITISDTGKGIDEELGEKLFQKYASSNSSTNSVGLGLTISKGLIDLMNGTISFESKANQGTTFYITIPLPIIANSSTNSDIVENNSLDYALNILLVDDNKINLLVLEKQLKNELKNSHFTTAKNGLEALNLIIENQYDLVLMDVIMPVMDGISATRHVRELSDENKKNIPIIALTANVGEKELSACLNVGMNDFVTKPFEINALLKTIFNQYNSKTT